MRYGQRLLAILDEQVPPPPPPPGPPPPPPPPPPGPGPGPHPHHPVVVGFVRGGQGRDGDTTLRDVREFIQGATRSELARIEKMIRNRKKQLRSEE